MKILHTADWHLGDRLGRIDRTADLRRAVERVAGYCAEYEVEVLLIAGDLFSEMARPDSLRSSIEHLQRTFQPFLLGGGTILALTGNHDNENFCQTLRLVMTLAAPAADEMGALHPAGRLYLATNPTFLRLRGRQGEEAQFILMPYPTPAAYVALGHIHQHHCVRGLSHVRYCGSIERLDAGESDDVKGVVLADIGSEGLRGEPRFLPLDATPIYKVDLDTPLADALERERARGHDASGDLVHIAIRYTAGQDNLEETLRQLDTIFPRWYAREWSESS